LKKACRNSKPNLKAIIDTDFSKALINGDAFFAGEVRVLIQEYLLIRHGLNRGGQFQVYVTQRRTAASPPEVISNRLNVAWPLKREVVRQAPRTRFTPDNSDDVPPPPDE